MPDLVRARKVGDGEMGTGRGSVPLDVYGLLNKEESQYDPVEIASQ